ncbi:MAG: hypothetical protein WA029_13700 [Anaerolineae bacterium]
MALSAQMTALRLFRIALFVKVITILASLLVALALGERAAQQHLSLAMFLTTLLLVLFGTNWLEARLGAAYFPLALLLAIPPQALEWGLRPLVPGQNLLTDFGAVEPFLFLVLLVVLAAGRYGFGAALLATVAAAIAHSLAVLWFDGLAHVDLISLAARLFILGAAAMTTAWLRLPQPAATDTHSLPVPVTDKLSADDLRRRLARVLLELDARVEGIENRFADDGTPLAYALALTRLDISHARALANLADPACTCRLGLEEAVRHHVATFRERTGANVALQLCLAPDSLGPEQAAAAFHIVEESLNSLASRPDAQASVSLKCSGSHVALSVHGQQDGADAVFSAADARLNALRQRVEAVGGMFCISHQAQSGTTVACVFPRRV